jgi:hypothetical protein
MIGHVIMEVEHAEIVAAIQFYLNHSVFNTALREYHKANVTEVRQRTNGNFAIEFDGLPNKEHNDGSHDIS